MTDIEDRYIKQVSLERRRALGQFFTPPGLARLMAAWCLAGGARSLLDPAVGTGLLVREALRLRPALRAAAYDSDAGVLSACSATLPPEVDLRCADFLLAQADERFEAIVSNPPYLGYKQLPYDEAIFTRYDERCGIRVNRQSNLYVLFILAITQHLAPQGRAAILVPSDWLNGNFGAPLKAYLLREQLLDGLVVFDQSGVVFNDSLATACLLLLRRGRAPREPVRLAYACGQALAEEPDLDRLLADSSATMLYDPAALAPQQKWLSLLPAPHSAPLQAAGGLVPLGALASVRRGIATGANSFFVLSAQRAESLALPRQLFKLCLSRATHAPLADISPADVTRLIQRGCRVLMLDPPAEVEAPALARYLEHGAAHGVDRRYLPAHRRPWYRMEQRAPAPILFTTFSRAAARFVLNRPLLSHLTAFHGITLHADLQTADWLYERALLAYLLTSAAVGALRAQQRLYGAGLRKYEPADVAQLLVPDLRRLERRRLEEPAALFDRYCRQLRAGATPDALHLLERRWPALLSRL